MQLVIMLLAEACFGIIVSICAVLLYRQGMRAMCLNDEQVFEAARRLWWAAFGKLLDESAEHERSHACQIVMGLAAHLRGNSASDIASFHSWMGDPVPESRRRQ